MTTKSSEGFNKVNPNTYNDFVECIKLDKRTERQETSEGTEQTTHYVLWCLPDEVRAIAKQWGFKLQPETLHPRFCVSSPLVFHKKGPLAGKFSLDLVSVMTDYVEVARNV